MVFKDFLLGGFVFLDLFLVGGLNFLKRGLMKTNRTATNDVRTEFCGCLLKIKIFAVPFF